MFRMRLALVSDINAMAQFLDDSWHRTYDDLIGVDKVSQASHFYHNAEKLGSEIADDTIIVMIAEDDGGLIGAGKIEVRSEGRLYLDRLHISPSMYGTGLGQALTDAMLAVVPESREIELSVLEANARAVAYYQKQGFEITKRQNTCEAVLDVPTLIMRKTLITSQSATNL